MIIVKAFKQLRKNLRFLGWMKEPVVTLMEDEGYDAVIVFGTCDSHDPDGTSIKKLKASYARLSSFSEEDGKNLFLAAIGVLAKQLEEEKRGEPEP